MGPEALSCRYHLPVLLHPGPTLILSSALAKTRTSRAPSSWSLGAREELWPHGWNKASECMAFPKLHRKFASPACSTGCQQYPSSLWLPEGSSDPEGESLPLYCPSFSTLLSRSLVREPLRKPSEQERFGESVLPAGPAPVVYITLICLRSGCRIFGSGFLPFSLPL